jgi:hypothetical protein
MCVRVWKELVAMGQIDRSIERTNKDKGGEQRGEKEPLQRYPERPERLNVFVLVFDGGMINLKVNYKR